MPRRPLATAFAVLCLALAGAQARAQEEGDRDEAPPPELDTDDGARRSVRGSPVLPVDDDPKLQAQERFEREELVQVPAPARRITAATRPEEVRPDLPWLAKLETGDIPVRWDPRVIRYLEFYKDDPRGRALMGDWLQRQGRFKDIILDALRRHELPKDLLYDCMIESSYDPKELSRVGAAGLWQFMPAGGRIYGLEQSYWIDERNDPIKSTEAVMLYWHDLYDRFGDWHLSLAAFNAGYGAVLKSMAKYNTNDFWHLLELEGGLPWESSVYVPKALATALVGHNKKIFGYDHIVPAPPFSFDRVTVRRSTPLATIARHAGVDESVIADLNPELRRNRTPAGLPEYELRIPKGSKGRLLEKMKELQAEWHGEDEYLVRHGERLEDVAMIHGLSPRSLRALNDIADTTEIRGGTVLVVPRLDEATRAANRVLAENELYRSELVPGAPGDPLLVPVPDKDFSVAGRERVFYRVVGGDTLAGVAHALGVRAQTLAAWNGLDPRSNITPRMIIVAWVPEDWNAAARQVALLDEARLMIVTSGSAEHLDIVEGRKGRVRKTVIARAGDTLEKIGKPYGLSKYDVARINRRGYTTPLVPGEELVVYQIVDKQKARAAGVKDTTHKNKPKYVKGRKARPNKARGRVAEKEKGRRR